MVQLLQLIFFYHIIVKSDLKKNLFEKTEVSIERNRPTGCNTIENLADHGIHCLPGSYTSDVTYVIVTTMTSY